MHTSHTYIHTYIHTYMHTYIHTYIHTYRHTYRHTYGVLRSFISYISASLPSSIFLVEKKEFCIWPTCLTCLWFYLCSPVTLKVGKMADVATRYQVLYPLLELHFTIVCPTFSHHLDTSALVSQVHLISSSPMAIGRVFLASPGCARCQCLPKTHKH